MMSIRHPPTRLLMPGDGATEDTVYDGSLESSQCTPDSKIVSARGKSLSPSTSPYQVKHRSGFYRYTHAVIAALSLFAAGLACGFFIATRQVVHIFTITEGVTRKDVNDVQPGTTQTVPTVKRKFVLDEFDEQLDKIIVEDMDKGTKLEPVVSISVPNRINDDRNSLYDFAFVGFPKTATTYMHIYFNSRVKEIYLTRRETCGFYNETTAHDLAVRSIQPYETCPFPKSDKTCEFDEKKNIYDNMQRLYNRQIALVDRAEIHGFKCPRMLEEEWVLPNAMRFMKKTRFIVQIRHPIEWMQSYYNYKAKTMYPERLLPLDQLPSVCDEAYAPYINPNNGLKHQRNVCTDRAKFHYAISRLAKTPMTSQEELDLLGHHTMTKHPTGEKVFLIENSQLNEDDPLRSKQLRESMALFLGINRTALPTFNFHTSDSSHQEKNSEVDYINICDDQYKDVRRRLLANGKQASTWLRQYFMESPDVIVSSKQYVIDRLKTWEKDPCDNPNHPWKIVKKRRKKGTLVPVHRRTIMKKPAQTERSNYID